MLNDPLWTIQRMVLYVNSLKHNRIHSLFFVTSLSEKLYPYFFWFVRNIWSTIILYGMGLIPKIEYKEPIKKGESYMLVANHKSMIDVFLMLKVSPTPFIFVGKKELLKLPIFGFFYKKFAIMVNRDSEKSRKAVYGHAERRLSQGLGICIFPEGVFLVLKSNSLLLKTVPFVSP